MVADDDAPPRRNGDNPAATGQQAHLDREIAKGSSRQLGDELVDPETIYPLPV